MQFPTKKKLSALQTDRLLTIHGALLSARNEAIIAFNFFKDKEPNATAFYKADADKYNDVLDYLFNE